ncbi:hypothetical protein TSAR_012824 [Trichomalopsis sarcophagae]|uniref:Uncharacterized protein n=1 Tax=Trichomalopsis sarcophagae TaxID=543379 RepID=A0A232F3V9_9HYME|nr:hypothetical protein TSAR_012824 [Trichomalopsis sarcophagae]
MPELQVRFPLRKKKLFSFFLPNIIKWRGSATKASLRSRRSRFACDTIYFYIGVRILHDTEKNAYCYCS